MITLREELDKPQNDKQFSWINMLWLPWERVKKDHEQLDITPTEEWAFPEKVRTPPVEDIGYPEGVDIKYPRISRGVFENIRR